jgi:hypothetical protein
MATNEKYRHNAETLRVVATDRYDLVAPNLIEVLNGSPQGDHPARAEVLKIFEMCRRLDELWREHESERFSPKRFNRRNDEARSIRQELNAALEAFSFTPFLFGLSVDIPITIFWEPVRRADLEAEFKPGAGPVPIASIIKIILGMTETRTLSRARQCICGKWFYAERNKKQVCSDACRAQKFIANNPDYNQKQAEKMRKYRATLKKNPKVKAKPKRRNTK